MNFELELSKGKQNSLGETLKVVDFIKKNPKKVEHLFQCFYSENSLDEGVQEKFLSSYGNYEGSVDDIPTDLLASIPLVSKNS